MPVHNLTQTFKWIDDNADRCDQNVIGINAYNRGKCLKTEQFDFDFNLNNEYGWNSTETARTPASQV